MQVQYLWLIAVLAQDLTSVLVLYSSSTPQSLISEFQLFPLIYEISHSSRATPPLIHSSSLLLDLTTDSSFFPYLDGLSLKYNLVYLTLSQSDNRTYSESRYYLHPFVSQKVQRLGSLISHLNWKSFSVFYADTNKEITLAFELRSKLNQSIKNL